MSQQASSSFGNGQDAHPSSARPKTDPVVSLHITTFLLSWQRPNSPSAAEALEEDFEELAIRAAPEDPNVAPAIGSLQEGVAALDLRGAADEGQSAGVASSREPGAAREAGEAERPARDGEGNQARKLGRRQLEAGGWRMRKLEGPPSLRV